jgi:NADH dehydrogenase
MSVPVVTIFGGSGFIGRYVAQRMARAGWRVRVAVRRPEEAYFVRPYGVVGQVEPIQANVRDEASTRRAIRGADAVINCVGVLAEAGPQTFEALIHEGAGRVARIAAEEGVGRLVHVSAIGADEGSDSRYAAAKGRGEAAVRAAFPSAVILRPSVVFGTEDEFFNRFARMARLSPVLPLVGADTRFQPVYVDDVAAAAATAVLRGAEPGVYELGGPEVASFRELMQRMLGIIRRRRRIVALPLWLARPVAGLGDFVSRLTRGLVAGPLTADQIRQLSRDNVVAEGARGLGDLGIEATPMQAVLEGYLYAYRPAGQYTEIQESALRVRT